MIQIFYGLGKGKTSALNGQAIRSHGAGLKVGIFRFLKGQETSEDKVLMSLGIIVKKFHSSEKFVIQMNEEEKEAARKSMHDGIKYIQEHKDEFDIILLDEILDLVASSVMLISEEELTTFIKEIAIDKEIFVSGHTIVKQIFSQADLITFFDKEKHYFDRGVKARKGIEF